MKKWNKETTKTEVENYSCKIIETVEPNFTKEIHDFGYKNEKTDETLA